MPSLCRHTLVFPTPPAWQRLVCGAPSDAARAAYTHWAAHDLPLVVTRQDAGMAPHQARLGLPVPPAWGGQRLVLQLARQDIARTAAFPRLSDLADDVPPCPPRLLWRWLEQALHSCGVSARVYGSHGWQCLTGITYTHPQSDLDLLLPVAGRVDADAAVRVLAQCQQGELPRLDGELVFPDGTAVAWREWLAWRGGRSRQIMRKRQDRVDLVADDAWLLPSAAGGAGAAA